MVVHDPAGSATQSVERALSILTCFSDAQPRLRVADLVEQLGLSQSTVSRLLKTMELLGFIERDPKTGLYQLGLEMVTLAGVALNQVELRSEAMVELSSVAAELGLGANLAILRNDALFYLASVEGPKAPKRFTMIGKRGPLHCTGMGKVLLAHLPTADREALLGRIAYPQFTPYTAGSAEELGSMLTSVLTHGYAREREELAFGRACVAAPIRNATGAVVAATSISGPLRVMDLDRREAELAARVIELGDQISYKLGYITVPATVAQQR
jgi:DNA-binding IclR family transcriptional regulator